jgi:hypothetical protein
MGIFGAKSVFQYRLKAMLIKLVLSIELEFIRSDIFKPVSVRVKELKLEN